MQTERASSYTETHKRFYQRHRDEIREKRKASDHDFYERNKERIKQRALAYYYAKKAARESQATTEPNLPDVVFLEAPAPDLPAVDASV